jgi:hypothetical protein
MGRPFPTFAAAELRRMRAAVEQSDVTLDAIARRYRVSTKTLTAIAEREGWSIDWRRVKVRKQMEARAANKDGEGIHR